MTMEQWKQPFFNENMPACALSGGSLSFCLVDESGDGQVYGGLKYEVFDSAGKGYKGHLNGDGVARIHGQCRGPVVLVFDAEYKATGSFYSTLQEREKYPLPITDLQVRAEQTHFLNPNGKRAERNHSRHKGDQFYQVEVSDLVRHIAHLPPVAPSAHRPQRHALKMMADLGFGPPQPAFTPASSLAPNAFHSRRFLCLEPVPVGIVCITELLQLRSGAAGETPG
jgi:hypothetical protein